METFLYILGLILLLESVVAKIFPILINKSPTYKRINAYTIQHETILRIISAFLIVSAYLLSHIEKQHEKNKIFERDLKISKLEIQNQEYRSKLNKNNSLIKTISLNYEVLFEIEEKVFHESLLADANVIYAQLGRNISLKSAGVSFRFYSVGNNKYIVTCSAGLSGGDYPYGQDISILKNLKTVEIYIPFMINRKLSRFKVHSYKINIGINGISLPTILYNGVRVSPINTGPYRSDKNHFGSITHVFSDNFYDSLKLTEHLITF